MVARDKIVATNTASEVCPAMFKGWIMQHYVNIVYTKK